MAGIGFRNGLFGYNKSDVNEFLQSQQSAYKTQMDKKDEQIKNLTEQIKILDEQVKSLETENGDFSEKITFLKGQLDRYRGKEEEIEKMSVGIGTMYLVAKQNAAEVIGEAERCSAAIAEQSKKQLDAIENADSSLCSIKSDFVNAAESFADEIDKINSELTMVKENLDNGLQKLNSVKSAVITDGNNDE